MIIIGLTGDAGSGKSTVSGILKELGAQVIDADQIAKDITSPGSVMLNEIFTIFGSTVQNQKGQLDRRSLAEIIFTDSAKRQQLNQIMHPPILREIEKTIAEFAQVHSNQVLVIDAPLLIETNLYKVADYIWLVKANYSLKMKRLLKRGIPEKLAAGMLASQVPEQAKAQYAHRIIDNNYSLTRTREQVINYWTQLELKW